MLGLLGSLTGQAMRGSGAAVAEANALHKGPVVFHIPQARLMALGKRVTILLGLTWIRPIVLLSGLVRVKASLCCTAVLLQGVMRRICQRAAAGDHDFAQLELDLFR